MFSKLLRSILPNSGSDGHQKNRKRRLERADVESTPTKKLKPVLPDDEDACLRDSPVSRVAGWVNRSHKTFCDNYYVRKVVDSPKALMNKLKKGDTKAKNDVEVRPNPPFVADHRRYMVSDNRRPETGVDVHYSGDLLSGMQVHSTPIPPSAQPVGYSFTESSFDLKAPEAFNFGPGDDYKFQAPRALPPRLQDRSFLPLKQQLHRPPIRPGADDSASYTYNSGPRSMYDKTFRASNSQRRRGDSRNRSRLAVKESIRLDERNRYAQLLQQFTSTPLPGTVCGSSYGRRPAPKLFNDSSSDRNDTILGTSVTTIGPKCTPTAVLKSPAPRPQVTPNKSLAPARSTPPFAGPSHAVVTPGPSRGVVTIDLTESGDEGNRPHSSFNHSRNSQNDKNRSANLSQLLQNSDYLSDSWVDEVRSKYSAETKENELQLIEQELRTKVFKEKRDEWDKDLEKRLRQRLRLSERERGVAEEIFVESEESSEDEEGEEEFPCLSADQESQIDAALVPYPSDQVISEGFKLQIRREDIQTLKGLQWLNDEVINFYMNMLVDRGSHDNRPSVHAFNTFFYPKIMSGGQASVRRWTKKIDVFAMDYVLVPVHLGMHWCLAVIDFLKKEIRYYDSMGGQNQGCLQALRKYLLDESMDKKKQTYDVSQWSLINVKDIPQQMNGSDCGMFACKFAEYVTRNARITFTQEHMPYFRRRMVYEILNKSLL